MPNSGMRDRVERDVSNSLTADEIESIVAKAVHRTLKEMGLSVDDAMEMQKDFQHLRSWRTSTDEVKRLSLATVVTVIITGTLGALWLIMTKPIH